MGETTNYKLPVYGAGDVATFLTSEGWNAAMQELDTALKGIADGLASDTAMKLASGVTYVGICEQGSTTAEVAIPTISENDRVMVIAGKAFTPTSITVTAGTGVTVEWDAAATTDAALGFNVTVYSAEATPVTPPEEGNA